MTHVPPAPEVAPAPPRSWLRRWRWLLLFGALIVSMPVILYQYHEYAARRQLETLLAQLDASDPGWRLEDIEAARPVLPDEQNAAVLAEKLAAALGPFILVQSANWSVFEKLEPPDGLSAEQDRLLRETLQPFAALRAEALRLRQLPQGRYATRLAVDHQRTRLTHLERNAHLRHFLHWDALWRAEQEDSAGALHDLHALLAAARAIGDEPSVMSMLVRNGGHDQAARALERVLAQGEAADADLRPVQELIECELREPLLLHAARGERAGVDQMYRAMAEGRLRPSEPWKFKLQTWGMRAPYAVTVIDYLPHSVSASHAAHLELLTGLVEIARLPPKQRLAAQDALRKRMKAKSLPLVAQLMMEPAYSLLTDGLHVPAQAKLRCALVALAAERYRLRHDAWPPHADALVQEGLLAALPADPYDGEPLRWRLLADGAAAYSLGPNRVDNGATFGPDAFTPNTDVGFRLWDPRARRRSEPP
jgi:hypothetical protein